MYNDLDIVQKNEHYIPMKIDNQQEFNLLRKISKKPNANQRELASDLNISLGKLNYVLKELKNKGLVKINNFKTILINQAIYIFLPLKA